MPVYLFTFHGRGTWMPDHPRGYVHPKRGLQPCDPVMGANYRRNQREPAVFFDAEHQRVIIEASRRAAPFLDITIHAVANEPTHSHVLASWKHDRVASSLRRSLRRALSITLNEAFGKRDWFAEKPPLRRVRTYDHLDYLVLKYLPEHKGEHWEDPQTVARCERRDAQRTVSVKLRKRRTKKRGTRKPND